MSPRMRIASMAATLVALAFTATTAGLFPTHRTNAEAVTNVRVPFAVTVPVPCVNGGAGENVQIAGTIHFLVTATTDSSGGDHSAVHSRTTGTGTGLTSGDTYRLMWGSSGKMNMQAALSYELTVLQWYRVVGKGAAGNFEAHITTHLTVGADGTFKADVSNVKVTCK